MICISNYINCILLLIIIITIIYYFVHINKNKENFGWFGRRWNYPYRIGPGCRCGYPYGGRFGCRCGRRGWFWY
jgi:hypothetical protein